MKIDLLIKNANQVITVAGGSEKPKTKQAMSDVGIIEQGAIAISQGMIIACGLYEEVVKSGVVTEETITIDATGKTVLPGFVDPHTHLVFAGSRENELEMRLDGAAYLDILEQGGGILSTVRSTRLASHDRLMTESKKRLDQFLLHGVTTVEAKSGYGLTLEDEWKQLKVARELGNIHPLEIVSTFMGAHAIPEDYRGRTDDYVDLIINEMIPFVAETRLAEFCDVFCEKGVFSIEQSERILRAGQEHGLKAKIHADEIVSLGGAELAAKVGAISADHLLQASEEGIMRLAEAGVIAVLLPGTAFFLMTNHYAKARTMIDEGVPVALSTDRNPGSSPTESIQLIMNLACLQMKMTPAEVITAATINAAHAIDRANQIGSIEVGKKADIVIMDVPNYKHLTYHYGVNHVQTVIKNGVIVVDHQKLCY